MTPEQREQLIKTNEELVIYYNNLAYTMNSEAGKQIVTELTSKLNDLNNDLYNVAMRSLDPPYYEYHKDELQKMKALRAQKDIIAIVINDFDPKRLQQLALESRAIADKLIAGENLAPVY